MLDKLKRFFTERAKWKKAGQPRRSNDKIQILFEICKQCDKYQIKNSVQGTCGECGCRITNVKEYWNKLAWATTRCPLEKPKWVEEEEYLNKNIVVSEEDILNEEKIEKEQVNKPAPKKGGCGCGR